MYDCLPVLALCSMSVRAANVSVSIQQEVQGDPFKIELVKRLNQIERFTPPSSAEEVQRSFSNKHLPPNPESEPQLAGLQAVFENTSIRPTRGQLLPGTHILYVAPVHVWETGSVITPDRKTNLYSEIWH